MVKILSVLFLFHAPEFVPGLVEIECRRIQRLPQDTMKVVFSESV